MFITNAAGYYIGLRLGFGVRVCRKVHDSKREKGASLRFAGPGCAIVRSTSRLRSQKRYQSTENVIKTEPQGTRFS